MKLTRVDWLDQIPHLYCLLEAFRRLDGLGAGLYHLCSQSFDLVRTSKYYLIHYIHISTRSDDLSSPTG